MKISFYLILSCICVGLFHSAAHAQILGHGKATGQPQIDAIGLQALRYRNIGPFRGGRSVAVAGSDKQPKTYYTGFAGGGVYKTTDGGETWKNVSDGYFKTGSVGAIAVAPSDPNVVYAGMGEKDIRGNMLEGDGIYKSTNGGETWAYIGLGKTRAISRIVINPRNPKVVWVAAMGEMFGKKGNEQRGVYKTTDGGKTWKKVLYHDKHTAVTDLTIDPNNPDVLIAALWQAYRTGWNISSGGPGSGLYKTTDGGDTWTNITHNPGLPKGINGKIGVAISPADPSWVYAIIQNKHGGLFRSEDGGKTWELINKKQKLRQRPFYFFHIYADPKDRNNVYALDTNFRKSVDGGRSFHSLHTPHADHHDLWIAPNNPNRMIVADDGGGQVTFDGGRHWSSMDKYATGQFYHVSVDNRFPYRLYGAQQDSGPIEIKSRTKGFGITKNDWQSVAGGESGFTLSDPQNPHITYGASYGGNIERYNEQTERSQRIDVWPNMPVGAPAKDQKERFAWTIPLFISPHKPYAIYALSQHVNRSTNQGKSWERMSPDLTRNTKATQQQAGGPIHNESNTGSYYNTISAFTESPVKRGVLWAGSDDGLVHLSRDNGKNWHEVTPHGMPQSQVRAIDPSPFDAGTAYMAVDRHQFADFAPMLYKTTNYGKSWTKITKGIPDNDYTRVIREDPCKKGLLYAGTKSGVYVSFNDGKQWQPLKLNLPNVLVSDLEIQKRAGELAISTMGRGFWILSGLYVLRQIDREKINSNFLYKPKRTYLYGGRSYNFGSAEVGENPPNGVTINYNLKDSTEQNVQLQFVDSNGKVIQTYSSTHYINGKAVNKPSYFYVRKGHTEPSVLTTNKGLNEFTWDMRYPGATPFNGPQVLFAGTTRGPKAIPGTYEVRLIIDGKRVMSQPFEIKKDPRIKTTQDDFRAQFALHTKIVDKLDTLQKTFNEILKMEEFIKNQKTMFSDNKRMIRRADSLLKTLNEVKHELVQTKFRYGQIMDKYPPKLRNKVAQLSSLVGHGDNRPTKQMYEYWKELSRKVDVQLQKVHPILTGNIMEMLGLSNS